MLRRYLTLLTTIALLLCVATTARAQMGAARPGSGARGADRLGRPPPRRRARAPPVARHRARLGFERVLRGGHADAKPTNAFYLRLNPSFDLTTRPRQGAPAFQFDFYGGLGYVEYLSDRQGPRGPSPVQRQRRHPRDHLRGQAVQLLAVRQLRAHDDAAVYGHQRELQSRHQRNRDAHQPVARRRAADLQHRLPVRHRLLREPAAHRLRSAVPPLRSARLLAVPAEDGAVYRRHRDHQHLSPSGREPPSRFLPAARRARHAGSHHAEADGERVDRVRQRILSMDQRDDGRGAVRTRTRRLAA